MVVLHQRSLVRCLASIISTSSRSQFRLSPPMTQRWIATESGNTNLHSYDQKNITHGLPETSSSTKSVDDFSASNIFTGGIPFFSDMGMVIFRIQPAMFKKNEKGSYSTVGEGWLYVTFYPKATELDSNKFDTKRKVAFYIRAVNIGSILEINAQNMEKDVSVQGSNAYLQVILDPKDGCLILKCIPLRRTESCPESIECRVTTGQFRTLQTVLTHASPALFGWQVYLDPRMVTNFMDPRSLKQEEEEKEKQEKLSFFEN